MSYDLTIKPIDTNKHKIPQRVLMKNNIIPKHPSSVIFNGCSGSGKSTLLLNMLTRPMFFKNYFDHIFLFSPTGDSDDLYKSLKIPKENIFVDLEPDDLDKIMIKQRELVESKGVHKSPKLLIILDDIQGNKKFMNSKPFLRSFIANRHFGMSTWLCGQSFTRTPRACRLQANNIFIFRATGSEIKILCDEFCPANMTKKEFMKLIDTATKDRHSFLHINMRMPQEERYRKNLDTILMV